MTVLTDSITITERNNQIIYKSVFERVMTPDEIIKFKSVLNNNINRIKKELNKLNDKVLIDNESKKLDLEHEAEQQMYKDFDKHIEKTIEKIRENIPTDKIKLRESIESYPSRKQKLLRDLLDRNRQSRELFNMQLTDDIKQLQVYIDYEKNKKEVDVIT